MELENLMGGAAKKKFLFFIIFLLKKLLFIFYFFKKTKNYLRIKKVSINLKVWVKHKNKNLMDIAKKLRI
jgi:hypothetical protein